MFNKLTDIIKFIFRFIINLFKFIKHVFISIDELAVRDANKPYKFIERKDRVSSGVFVYEDIDSIYYDYVSNPYEFEVFCADIFYKLGYRVQITSRSNDNGADLVLYRSGKKYVAECKCYDPSRLVVGRPVLQKLVGANTHFMGDKLIVITTATFSKPAIDYAAMSNIILVDGSLLYELYLNTL